MTLRHGIWALGSAAAVAAIAVGAALVAATSSGGDGGPTPHTSSGTYVAPDARIPAPNVPTVYDVGGPGGGWRVPAIVVAAPGRQLSLRPWTFCYAKGCADGSPELLPSVPDIGNPPSVTLWFARPGWRIEATFVDTNSDCPRRTTVTATRLDPHTFRLDTYGLELFLDSLAETPQRATASVSVRDAAGTTVRFQPPRDEERPGCFQRGSVGFRLEHPDISGLAAGPYTYDVTLDLDGATYRASATWPDDEEADHGPSVPLTFTPPLPAPTLGR
ncbi:hypothetical protein [Nocardioides sp. CER19]|uniref:hypothetical protein n=1 Tax=Nocardioides sp. CER19 TaxID=3038538 RepID=UPI002447D4C7|nr:hypothetical protein [Nocardioides sp. CER19]MDH2415770.1 hypothetical protein [Nocardioides sp. CER19]